MQKTMMKKDIATLIFDADDTLWDCQTWFDRAEERMIEMLEPWLSDRQRISDNLIAVERANMPLFGYGTKAFTLSLMENAIRLTDGRIGADQLLQMIEMGKQLLRFPVDPLPGVEQTLQKLHDEGCYRLVVFTKGELMGQEDKIQRSGLRPYFSYVEIVSDKTEAAYRSLCDTLAVEPQQTLMVGNSFRSDIAPALAAGAWAVHIPFHAVWAMEQSEEFPHERLTKIERFSQLPDCL